ncbi:putative membrane protein [Patellaria atrata CBS 101060]|uniref:Membrane protein n=1 Tax=Patellaria atrata CBS 101060 TaxID=1346257 RepID=A0A9P4SJF4_9PEZI|nr:putative membrane protein [Patellaria atrata CBS 101060]
MSTTLIFSESVPRFLLPRLSWVTAFVRPAIAYNSFQTHSRTPHQARYNSARTATPSQTVIPDRRVQLKQNATPRPQVSHLAFKAARRAFSTTTRRHRDHHFDTLKFVQRLKEEGFTEDQAVAMMKVLSDVIEESIQNLTRTMVLREDQEKASYTQKVDFSKLRSELLTADSSESSLTRASHDRLTNELAKLNSRLRDEIQRTQASLRLDLSLEKGRIRDEANVQDMKIKETETRIEQETAVLRERLEAIKFSTLQWLMGVCTGAAALILGAWRLLM